MKKIMLFSLIIAMIGTFINCSDSTTTSSDDDYGLPTEFPLKVGNAWVYERVEYVDGIKDTLTSIDTLYIVGKHEDYYLYSWEPSFYFSLVKNVDNKLVNFGQIMIEDSLANDTTFYDLPNIWTFYGEIGDIDSTYYSNCYYNTNIDSEYISILPNENYLDESFDTYKRVKIYVEGYYLKEMNQYTNKLGFVCWNYFDENNNLTSSTEIIEKLENVYPKEVLINKKSSNKKSNDNKTIYLQDGMPLRKN